MHRLPRRTGRARAIAIGLALSLGAAACGEDSNGPGARHPARPDDRLPGAATAPAASAIVREAFVARPEDYTATHPTLPGVFLSFNTFAVVFDPAATVGQVNAVLDDADARIVGGIPGGGSAPGVLFLRVPTRTHAAMETLLARLRARPAVALAVQDGLLEPLALSRPNGGAPAAWTWEVAPSGGNWGMELVRAPQLWNLNAAVRKTGDSTVTGVLDVGFETNHPDLAFAANLSPGRRSDHGTHVAGIVGATFDNGAGVDGVNPFARLVVSAPVFQAGALSVVNGLASFGGVMVWGLDSLIRARPDMRVVNLSVGYNWGPRGIDADVNPAAQAHSNHQAGIFQAMLSILEGSGVPLPVLVVAAGNDGGQGFGDQEARFSSPMADAGLAFGAAPVIVVEAVGQSATEAGGARHAPYSNINGHLSAPGTAVLSTDTLPVAFSEKTGTSMAAPHVTGLVSYLYALDPTLPRPTLTTNPMRDLLVATAVPVAGGAAPRIDAFAAALEIDHAQRGVKVLRRLLDIDDGSADGNRRVTAAGGVEVGEDLDGDGGVGDGQVDMSDFRRWRDWLLEATNDPGIAFDGPPGHPKRDVNGDGIPASLDENVYPRGDFNGDGRLDRAATRAVAGALGGAALTDLQVLQQLFSDPDYQAADLPALVSSADLEISPAACLALPGVASVRSTLRVTGTQTPLYTRTHTAAAVARIITAPVNAAGYTARAVALSANGDVLGEAETAFPLELGSDTRWEPTCGVLELGVIFPLQVTPGTPTRLDVDVRRRDPGTGALTPEPGARIDVTATGGSVSSSSGSTDAQGHFATNATLAAGSPTLTLFITATGRNGGVVTKLVTAAAAPTGAVCAPGSARVLTTSVVRITSAAEAAALADVVEMTRSLTIEGSGAGFEVDLPCLRRVGEVLTVTGGAVTSVRLSALTEVTTGEVSVIAAALTRLELPALLRVGEGIKVGGFPFFSSNGQVIPRGNPLLTQLVIGAAQLGRRCSGCGSLALYSNPALTSLDGISSGVVVTRSLLFGIDAIANGFGEAQALALANRITVATSVCSETGLAEHCYRGPPWVP